MGVVKYSPGIEYVKGSLAKPQKKDGHNHGDYLIGTHREAETQNENCTRLYIRKQDAYKRTTPVSSRELEARGRFTAVAAAVRTRSKDLMSISSDQAAFLAQKDQPGGKKTMKAYLWKVCGDAWDAEHGA
jgi:hypothetical protein